MKFSRNPISGALESYNDDGAYGGNMVTMAEFIHGIATDGGPGSGNHNHAGRPGQVGGSAPAEGGGGGTTKLTLTSNKMKVIEIGERVNSNMVGFKKMNSHQRLEYAQKKGFMPNLTNDPKGYEKWYNEAKAKGMTTHEYLNYCAERYYASQAAHGKKEYVTPLKKVQGQESYIQQLNARVEKVMDNTGVDRDTAHAMLEGLKKHFSNGQNADPWIDRYIDADGRYEGPIYRWKAYEEGSLKLANILDSLKPGAKIGSKYDSNWSFSSDPNATSGFGSYKISDEVTILYVCDENITGAPVQCFSTYGDSECEVIPHSKTTWTIQTVEKLPKAEGGWMYEVHMTEDDWHEERGIPVWNYEEEKNGWRIKFPRDMSDAQRAYDKVKQSGDKDLLKEFTDKLPDDTELLFQGEDAMLMMKKVDGKWKAADVPEDALHGNIWKNVQDHQYFMADFEVEAFAGSYETQLYKMESDAFSDKKYEFDKAKKAGGGFSEEMAKLLADAPEGTAIATTFAPFSMEEMMFVKKGEKWEDENQVYPNSLSTEQLKILMTNESELKAWPKEQPKTEAPKTYGEVQDKLFNMFDNDDYNGATDMFKAFKPKTEVINNETEEVWTKMADGTWKNSDSGEVMQSIDLAHEAVNNTDFDIFNLPHEPYKTTEEADSAFKDIIENIPVKVGGFVGECPNGTAFYSPEGGGLYFKKFDGKWKMIEMLKHPDDPTPEYWENHGREAVPVKNLISDMLNKLQHGSYVVQYGKKIKE